MAFACGGLRVKISVKDTPSFAASARCWVNEAEVSSRCFEADDEAGYALCYVLETDPSKGTFKQDDKTKELLVERLEGVVRLEYGK